MATFSLKYISKDVDRHGNVRLYFRRRGHKKVRLRGPVGSKEFLSDYNEALDGGQKIVLVASPVGTFRWLCIEFYRHCDNFKSSSEGWKRICARDLDLICTKYAEAQFNDLSRKGLLKIRDELKDTPNGKNTMIKVMSVLFSWALEKELVEVNPAVGIKKIKIPSATTTITREEIVKFIEFHGKDSKAYLGMILGITTGLRVSDLARLGKAHRRGDTISIKPGKTRKSSDVEVTIPLAAEAIEALSRVPQGNLVFLVRDNGVPFTVKGLSNRYKKWFIQAGMSHISVHSLRRGAATLAAENGATENDLKAMFGWTTSDQPTRYTRAADRKRLGERAASLLRVPTSKE